MTDAWQGSVRGARAVALTSAALCDPLWMRRALKYIFAVGGLLTILGLIMIPLPGPGNLLVSLGLQVLALGLFLSVVDWLSRRWQDPSNL